MNVYHVSTVHERYDNRILNKQCVSLSSKYSVTLVVSDGKGDELIKGVKILDMGKPVNRVHRILGKSFKSFYFASKSKADVIHFHDPELIPLAILYSLLGFNIIYDIHEDYRTSIMQKKYLPKKIKKITIFIVKILESFTSIFSHQIIAEKYYKKRFPNASTVLNYPIKKKLISTKFGGETLLYTGNVTENRGAYIMAKLPVVLDQCHLKIVGKCSSHIAKKMRDISKNSENMKLIGIDRYIPFSEMIYHYEIGALAGIALFPATPHYMEKELTKFFEYMSMKLPIIASDFPVWKKLIVENNIGICVNINKDEDIINAVKWLKNNPAEARKMGERGYNLVSTVFNWDVESVKLFSIYSSIEKN